MMRSIWIGILSEWPDGYAGARYQVNDLLFVRSTVVGALHHFYQWGRGLLTLKCLNKRYTF